MSRFILRASAQVPHQVPTCLGYLPSALDHFIVGTRTSTANTDLPYSQDDYSPGSLHLFKISAYNIKPTALAVGSSDGSIRTFTAGGSPPRLTPSKTFALFSEKAAITSIRFHPLHPGVLACMLYSCSVYVIRIPGHGLQGDQPKILWTLASHSPSPAWNLSWSPEPSSAPSEFAEVSSGIYSVGNDGNLFMSYWTLLEDVTDPNEMTTEDPVRFYSEGVTSVAVIPSNSTPSRDVVITAGRDGKLKISNLLRFDLDADRKTFVETSIGTGSSSQLIGSNLLPEGYQSDEDYVPGSEDEQGYDPYTNPNYVDPDAGAGVPMDTPEADSRMGPLQNEYFVLAGETNSGLSMFKVERASTEDGGSETWTLDNVATFDGHWGEKLGAIDVHKIDGKINGASASATMLDGKPSMTVCAWLFEP
ncbi:hypothetical protein V491_02739 [Pseudogymnoascus sp. VKM F-3775]|nr:hypothetical protein V491_02739 [Pseudogymnoascus sp. VKM F-3775]